MSDRSLVVAVIDENPVRSAIVEEGLREAGMSTIIRIAETDHLLRRLAAVEPDVIIIGLENPSRDTLEQMFQVSRLVRRPVAMFVDQTDHSAIEDAIEAGVSAYVVDGLRKDRVKSVLDVAVSRYNAFARLRDELETARSELEERKTIDKAKSILMQARNLSEADAYALLRRGAMNEKRRIVDIARSVITAAELFK